MPRLLIPRIAIWVIMFHFLRLDRLRWFFFILFGWGVHVKDQVFINLGIFEVRDAQ
jgi:hypothetical protein